MKKEKMEVAEKLRGSGFTVQVEGKRKWGTKQTRQRESASQARNASWDCGVAWAKSRHRGRAEKGRHFDVDLKPLLLFPFPLVPVFFNFLLFCLCAITTIVRVGWAIHLFADVTGKNGVVLRLWGFCCVREGEIEKERGWGFSVEGHQSPAGVKKEIRRIQNPLYLSQLHPLWTHTHSHAHTQTAAGL